MRACKRLIVQLALGSAMTPAMALGFASASAAQTRIAVPSLPMAEALERIGAMAGGTVKFDPDAIAGVTSNPVSGARDVEAAIRQAIRGRPLTLLREPNGVFLVVNDIVVQARRDEAETELLVRAATTSARTGQTLRDQPRNTQVISSRLMQEQQSLTVTDALRNAGGVSVNTAAIQGGAEYSVRGFGAGGAMNGLSTSGNVTAGATQPVAALERIEVLKGPDAILLGADNQGGTINLVTKKPSTETLLSLEAQTGSFGLRRFVLDANNALDEGKRFSGRIIASASDADRNYGGYRGDKDMLFAPSLRFKDSRTDIILNMTLSEQSFGATPLAVLNPATNQFYDLPLDRPLTRERDQGIEIDTTQFYGEITHQPTSWLTLVARGQHRKLRLEQASFSPRAIVDPAGLLLIDRSRIRQQGNNDAVDTYARFDFATGPLTHKLTIGFNRTNDQVDNFNTTGSGSPIYNILTATTSPGTLPVGANTLNLQLDQTQTGYYSQYLLKAWKLSLLAGVRHNRFISKANVITFNEVSEERDDFTIPNFGAVFDVTDDIALFGTLAEGYSPVNQVGRDGQRLPNTESRNIEGGVKIDLFNDQALINVSWFHLRQSNLIITDPTDFLFPISVPGRQGKGIDLNITGRLLPGLEVVGSFTRTIYRPLTETQFVRVVVGQPRDQYSLYTSYRHPLGAAKIGAGAGLFGRSSAWIDSLGEFRSPASRQVDLNGFFELGRLNVNLNVRNVFDRLNYATSFQRTFIPVSEPRIWRLSVGYRFK